MIVRNNRLGTSSTNPLPIDDEFPGDLDALPFDGRPYLWVKTPMGSLIKCYRSYADYCDD